MRRSSLMAILSVLLVSLFLLSVLSNLLTGYPERPRPPEGDRERPERDVEEKEEQSVLLFKVSPVTPRLFWRVSIADYYTGLDWFRTTEEMVVEEFPQSQDTNATQVFIIEYNTSKQEILLPLPSPNSILGNLSLSPGEGLKFYVDDVADVYKIIKYRGGENVQLVYEASWHDIEVDDRLISHSNVSEEILNKYLQLPDMPIEVRKLAQDLDDPSYSTLDQVLADVQFLRTHFVYDVEARPRGFERLPQSSAVSSFIEKGEGVCFDAATALAVILRIQEIPARISIGYKPERAEGGKLLYYTTGAHAVTEVYLPPYGWIQFDATPPYEEDPLVKALPFKKESSPGSTLFYQLSITNRCNLTDHFELNVHSKQEWPIETAPEELLIQPFQTAYALLKVTIPHDADINEKDVVTITLASKGRHGVAFSILAITQVENIFYTPTTTSVEDIDEAVTRGDTFWVDGTVHTPSNKQVDNMTVFVLLTKRKEAEGTIVGKGFSKQGNFQVECVTPYFMEIGDYKAVLISLGTTQYAPSSSDSTIRVCAMTEMKLGPEEKFLLGYGTIHGHLLWDNGTGYSNAPLSLEITLLGTRPDAWKFQDMTSKDGSFRIETAFENPGLYRVDVLFSGNQCVLGSGVTRVVEFKRGLPVIQISGENEAIRGEVFNVTVTVQSEEVRVCGEPLTVTFDNHLLATIETRDDGSYVWSFLVESEETLGPHILAVSIKEGEASTVHTVTVKSKTNLNTKASDVAGGMFVLFSASLSDDHNQPIKEAEIVIDNYGLSWKTDENGNLTFLLDASNLWAENLVLSSRFEGSDLYLPVTTEEEVFLGLEISLPFLIPLVFPALVAVGFAYGKHLVTRLPTFRQTSAIEVAEQRALVKDEPVHVPQRMQALSIVLPNIEAQFPNVWGIRDALRIEIILHKDVLGEIQGREADVFIDEETVGSVRLSQQGRAGLCHVFVEKGEHKIRVILPGGFEHQSWDSEIKLRVVDYGEEIINLYNEFLEKLASHGIYVPNEMTARETENLIINMGGFDLGALSRVTTCFEKAEYSHHSMTREDYEITYLSLKELENGEN